MTLRFVLLVFLLIGFVDSYAQFESDVDQSVKITAEVNPQNLTITVNWIIDPRAVGFDLYRRVYGNNSWGARIGQFGTDTDSYLDADISPNVLYEYKIMKHTEEDVDGFGYIISGIEVEAVHNKGKALLVITGDTYQNVESQISRFQDALTADGWTNRVLIISNELMVSEVKEEILAAHLSEPFTTCLLLGDVPIALSGDVSPDGHASQGGAWAADLYYGDLDGEWTDEFVTTLVSQWPVNNNIPGDGKLDQSTIPSKIEISVGRIDFSNLPVFEKDEYQLLSDYIDKNIAYRTQEKKIRRRALIHNINPWIGAVGQTGIRGYSTIVGPDSIQYNDFKKVWDESYLWLYAASSGFHDLLFTVAKSEDFATKSMQAVFTNFFGSRFGNYDYTNNFMRSALGSGDVLSSCWVGAPHWYFHSMAMGFPLAHATLTTQNNDSAYSTGNNPESIHVNLLGDPTLALYPMENIKGLGAIEEQGFIELSWAATTDAEGYYIYRKSNLEDEFQLLNTIPMQGTSYNDPCQLPGQTLTYMVRGTRLESSPSGTFFNLSSGATSTIETTIDNSPFASFDFLLENDQIFLVDNSENADSISILGVDESIDQGDGSYLLIGGENGDVIILIAYNDCGVDTTSVELIISSVDIIDEVEINVYPNPASTSIQVKSSDMIQAWKILRTDGYKIKSDITNTNEVRIDVSDIAPGVYHIFLSTAQSEHFKSVVID